MSETYIRIEKIGISMYYGFIDASFIIGKWVYGNGRVVKNSQPIIIGASRHSTAGIDYAKFCGINSLYDLSKIEGKLINYAYDYEYCWNECTELIGLGKPSEFSKDGNSGNNEDYMFFVNSQVHRDVNLIDWDARFVLQSAGVSPSILYISY